MALLMTTGLLYIMQLLIDTGAEVIGNTEVRIPVDWISKPIVEQVIAETPRPTRLPSPVPLPRDPRSMVPRQTEGTGIPIAYPMPPTSSAELSRPGFSDGPLMNIVKVSPTYPPKAIQKGVSGAVTVRYDVLANGTVSNVVVVESSNRLFDEAAVEAAYRFRYKPRIVEGIAIETIGLHNRFVFKMED
jgi:protein TonB